MPGCRRARHGGTARRNRARARRRLRRTRRLSLSARDRIFRRVPASRQCVSGSRAETLRSTPRRLARRSRDSRARQRRWAGREPDAAISNTRPTDRSSDHLDAHGALRAHDGRAHARARPACAPLQLVRQSVLAVPARLRIARRIPRRLARARSMPRSNRTTCARNSSSSGCSIAAIRSDARDACASASSSSPTTGRTRSRSRCARSPTQSRLPDEVIVADDGSGEQTRATIARIAHGYPCRIAHVWQEDRGFRAARARNLGIAAACGDYIVMIDGDMVPHRDFIADHAAFACKAARCKAAASMQARRRARAFWPAARRVSVR